MVSCSVYGCSNASKAKLRKAAVTFHSFPLNAERRVLWIQAINRKHWCPSIHARICSIHFKEEDLDRTSLSCVRVREQAVPSIFLGSPSTMQSRKEILEASPQRGTSLMETCIEEKSALIEMVPSTLRERDIINEVSSIKVDKTDDVEKTPPKYRNLLAEKDKAIEAKDKIIASYKEMLASKDRCISRLRHRSYRAENTVMIMKNVLEDLKGKLNVAEESCMLGGISANSHFLVESDS